MVFKQLNTINKRNFERKDVRPRHTQLYYMEFDKQQI